MRQHLFYIALFRQKEIVGRVVLSTLVPALSHDVDDDGDDYHHHHEQDQLVVVVMMDMMGMIGNKLIIFVALTLVRLRSQLTTCL